MTARQLRALRGVAASGITTLLAATAHTLAGAGAPSVGLVAIAAILSAPPAVLLIGRRLSRVRTAAAVTAAQLVFHTTFVLFADPSAVVYAPLSGHHAMHAAPTMMVAHAADHAMSWPMIATHALAALVTLVLLLRGERMLRALGRGIRRLLPAVGGELPRLHVGRPARGVFAHIAPIAHRLAVVVSRRGPPVIA
ncbi:hypothetical protein [Microbacterium terrisoli]|jgi:hypothetical protein|uniref:hypothetical protein n=1 Tax=Microbacterium terrisoli TaxID=3242192 RepID=UPI002805E5A1|nr:hypothetical protein [Microbacterium protaetiae]